MAVHPREVDDDATLVVAVQHGDRDAFSELFRRHHPAVRRACIRRMRDMAEGDEVAQAAFVRAFERIDQCAGERRFGAWVQAIAQRLCVDAARARARTTPQEEPLRADEAVGPNAPEDALLRRQRASEVHAALATLPERQREVVIARDLEDRRPGEIAAALGLSIGAVDSLLMRGRRRLALAYRAAAGEQGIATTSSMALAGGAVAIGRPGVVGLIVDGARALRDAVVQAAVVGSAALPAAPGGARRVAGAVAVAVAGSFGSPAGPTAPPVAVPLELPHVAAPIHGLVRATAELPRDPGAAGTLREPPAVPVPATAVTPPAVDAGDARALPAVTVVVPGVRVELPAPGRLLGGLSTSVTGTLVPGVP